MNRLQQLIETLKSGFNPKTITTECIYCGVSRVVDGCLDGVVCVGDDRWTQCQSLKAKRTDERLRDVAVRLGMNEARFERGWDVLDVLQPGWVVARALVGDLGKIRAKGVTVLAYGLLETGKTHAMCLLLRDASALGYTVLKIQWSLFYLRYTDAMRRSDDLEEGELSAFGLIQSLAEPDFLLLDEILEDMSEASKRVLREVVYSRHNAKKPTFLTTNLAATELLESVLDERSASRLGEVLIKIRFNGKQFRKPDPETKVWLEQIKKLAGAS